MAKDDKKRNRRTKVEVELDKVQQRYELAEQEYQIKQLEYQTGIINQLLEARNTIVDSDVDSGNWWLAGQGTGVNDPEDHQNMLVQAAKLYHTNPHARAVIRGLVKFTIGKGPTIVFDSDNTKVKEVWKDFVKRNRWSLKEKESGTRVFRDGEFFLRKFINKTNGDTTVRFIRANNVAEPTDRAKNIEGKSTSFGIVTDPDDVENVKGYIIVDGSGNYKETIPADEVIHEKIFCDSDQKRGVSLLRVCAKRIKQYEEWLEDRIVLNKVRSAIALVRVVDSGQQQVKRIRDNNKSEDLSDTRQKVKAFERGTVLTASKGIDYKMLSPNIQASDAQHDGRAILLSIAAGVGFPEMIFTADFSNANYSSSLIAQNPFVKEIEEWQDFFKCFYERLVTDVLQAKIEFGDLPKDTELGYRIDFPPMLRDDVDKIAKAFEILFKYKAVSKKTWQGKMGLDSDIETANMEDEEGDEFYPAVPGQPGGGTPFNNPLAPINQYGAQLMEAIRDGDQDEIEKIADKINQWGRPYGMWDDPQKWMQDQRQISEDEQADERTERNREFLAGLVKSFCDAAASIGRDLSTAVRESKSDINVTVEKQSSDINVPEIIVNTPEIKIDNISPVVNIPAVELKPNIIVERQTPDINIAPAEVNITTPEMNITNVIEDRPKKKTVQRDKDGVVLYLKEEYSE